MKSMLGPVIYACARRSWLCLDNLKNGKHFEAATRVALAESNGKPPRVIGIGDQQSPAKAGEQISFDDAFDHPRVWVSSPELAAHTLALCIRQVLSHKWVLKPVILFHPLFTPDDGWSDLELQSIAELWVNAGARRVMVSVEPGPYPLEAVLEKIGSFREYAGFRPHK